jgi:hypothetical protein
VLPLGPNVLFTARDILATPLINFDLASELKRKSLGEYPIVESIELNLVRQIYNIKVRIRSQSIKKLTFVSQKSHNNVILYPERDVITR